MSERQALREIFKLTLRGNYQSERKIRAICVSLLGEATCEQLRAEYALERSMEKACK